AIIAPAWASTCRTTRSSRRCSARRSNLPTTWPAGRRQTIGPATAGPRRLRATPGRLPPGIAEDQQSASVDADASPRRASRGGPRRSFRDDPVGRGSDVGTRPRIRHPLQPLVRQQFLDAGIERRDLGAQVLAFLLLDIELDLVGRLLQGEL